VYIWMSLLFGVLLLSAALFDLLVTIWLQSTAVLPSGWRSVIMVCISSLACTIVFCLPCFFSTPTVNALLLVLRLSNRLHLQQRSRFHAKCLSLPCLFWSATHTSPSPPSRLLRLIPSFLCPHPVRSGQHGGIHSACRLRARLHGLPPGRLLRVTRTFLLPSPPRITVGHRGYITDRSIIATCPPPSSLPSPSCSRLATPVSTRPEKSLTSEHGPENPVAVRWKILNFFPLRARLCRDESRPLHPRAGARYTAGQRTGCAGA